MKDALLLMADWMMFLAIVIGLVCTLDLMVFGVDRPGLFS